MDITWWHCLLQHWNGHSFFPPAAPSFHVYSDASGSFGCGAYSPELSSWFQLSWPQSWSTVSISAKELVPIVVAAAIWGHHWSGSHVCFHCNNDAVVVVIQNRNAHQDLLVQLLRCLFFYASRFQFHFSARTYRGCTTWSRMQSHAIILAYYLLLSHRPNKSVSQPQWWHSYCLHRIGDHQTG